MIPRGSPHIRTRRGVMMMELIMSLAICAMLLVSVAAAFSATSAAVTVNEDFFTATQAARISMNQMIGLLRRCDSCQPTGYDGVSSSVTGTSIGINYHDPGTTNYHTCTYQFVSGELQLVTGGATYSLAKNVSSLSFITDLAPDPQSQSGALRPVRITIDMVVKVGKQSIELTASTVPRNTIVYK